MVHGTKVYVPFNQTVVSNVIISHSLKQSIWLRIACPVRAPEAVVFVRIALIHFLAGSHKSRLNQG